MEKIMEAAAARVRAEQKALRGRTMEDESDEERAEKQRKEEEQRRLDEQQQQREAIERLEKALEESKKVEAEQAAKLEVVECDMCHEEIKRLGIHIGHNDNLPEEVVIQQQQKLARQHLAQLEMRAREIQTDVAPWWSHNMVIQTELTGEYLQDLVDAAADLHAASSEVARAMAAAEKDKKNLFTSTQESFRKLKHAQGVFERLWDDVLLRGKGECRRQRAPPGPKAEKAVLHARQLPPRPVSFVLPSAVGALLPPNIAEHIIGMKSPDRPQEDTGDSDEVAACPEEELFDIQGLGFDSVMSPKAGTSGLDSSPASPTSASPISRGS